MGSAEAWRDCLASWPGSVGPNVLRVSGAADSGLRPPTLAFPYHSSRPSESPAASVAREGSAVLSCGPGS